RAVVGPTPGRGRGCAPGPCRRPRRRAAGRPRAPERASRRRRLAAPPRRIRAAAPWLDTRESSPCRGREAEEHRKGSELAAKRVQSVTERFQRENTEKWAVAVFSEDHGGATDSIAVLEHRDARLAADAGPVRKAKLLLAQRPDTETLEHRRRHHGIRGAGIYEEHEPDKIFRIRGIAHLDPQC